MFPTTTPSWTAMVVVVVVGSAKSSSGEDVAASSLVDLFSKFGWNFT